ncbi:MAG: P-II family nitrogen regulator [Anaerovoracaceae bacterium]
MKRFECAYFIVKHGWASRILHYAREHDIFGGTIFYGTGTVKSSVLHMLSLDKTEKEIVIMAAEKTYTRYIMEMLSEELKMKKNHHGIAFGIPVAGFIGGVHREKEDGEEEDENMYNAVIVVLEKGKAEDALEAAQSAGADGGVIINARGAGRHETNKFMFMDIEPEKEILLMITPREKTDDISKAIDAKMNISKPGHGIMMIQEVSKIYGVSI